MSVSDTPRPPSTAVVITTEPWDDADGEGEGYISICWTGNCEWRSDWETDRLVALTRAGEHRSDHLAGRV